MQLLPNLALRSLIDIWAAEHGISSLPRFRRQHTLRVRSMRRSTTGPRQQGATLDSTMTMAAAVAAATSAVCEAAEALGAAAGVESAPAAPGTPAAAGRSAADSPGTPATPATPSYPDLNSSPGVVGSQRDRLAAALAALRPQQQRSPAGRAAAPYHAWTLMQLAGDAGYHGMLVEESTAIPLCIYLLSKPEETSPDALPHLCGVLRRLVACCQRAAELVQQCGGVEALVGLLMDDEPAVRVAACQALYFLGHRGRAIRWALGLLNECYGCACLAPALCATYHFANVGCSHVPAVDASQ